MQSKSLFRTTVLVLLCAGASASANIALDFVTVDDPGNPNDTVTSLGGSGLHFGGVNYTYAIGTYEVTLKQYTAFLNAVAVTDTYALYNPYMATDVTVAGIARSGSPGSYSYSVLGDGQRPAAIVSWFDAARFTNWLHNGQPFGLQTAATTEAGAYALGGATSGVIFSKSAGAQYWIPSENEWYKAAYYDPLLNGGTGGYWLYPTRSNSSPGNVVGNLSNQANSVVNGVYSVSQGSGAGINDLTNVGAFTNSASAYGTYDQGGGVFEWNDAVIGSSSAGMRGGSWNDATFHLLSDARDSSGSDTEYGTIGFRVATIPENVPEPGTAISLFLAVGLLLARRGRTV